MFGHIWDGLLVHGSGEEVLCRLNEASQGPRDGSTGRGEHGPITFSETRLTSSASSPGRINTQSIFADHRIVVFLPP
jgi:hypothetical protein